jgi:hypothetical protein
MLADSNLPSVSRTNFFILRIAFDSLESVRSTFASRSSSILVKSLSVNRRRRLTQLTQHARQSHAPSGLLVELKYLKSLISNPWHDLAPVVITFAHFAIGLPLIR